MKLEDIKKCKEKDMIIETSEIAGFTYRRCPFKEDAVGKCSQISVRELTYYMSETGPNYKTTIYVCRRKKDE